jgi:threonine synthase
VPESDVVEGMKLLARTEGVFTETAGGVTIATLAKLVKEGSIARGEETVALITGIGLKTLEALGSVEPTHRIEPRVEEVDRVLGTEGAEVQNR